VPLERIEQVNFHSCISMDEGGHSLDGSSISLYLLAKIIRSWSAACTKNPISPLCVDNFSNMLARKDVLPEPEVPKTSMLYVVIDHPLCICFYVSECRPTMSRPQFRSDYYHDFSAIILVWIFPLYYYHGRFRHNISAGFHIHCTHFVPDVNPPTGKE
jgi:hypothetical protein